LKLIKTSFFLIVLIYSNAVKVEEFSESLLVEVDINKNFYGHEYLLEEPSTIVVYSLLSGTNFGTNPNFKIFSSKKFRFDLSSLDALITIPIEFLFTRKDENKYLYDTKTDLSLFGISEAIHIPLELTLSKSKSKVLIKIDIPKSVLQFIPDDTKEKISRKVAFLLSEKNQASFFKYYLAAKDSNRVVFDMLNYQFNEHALGNKPNSIGKLLTALFLFAIIYLPFIIIILKESKRCQMKK